MLSVPRLPEALCTLYTSLFRCSKVFIKKRSGSLRLSGGFYKPLHMHGMSKTRTYLHVNHTVRFHRVSTLLPLDIPRPADYML